MNSYNYHQQSFHNASVHTSTHRSSTTCSSSSRKQARIEAELELSNLICEDLEVKLACINPIPHLFLKITFQSFASNLKFTKNKKNFFCHSNGQRNKNLNFNKQNFTHLCQNFHALTQKNSFNSLMSLAHSQL